MRRESCRKVTGALLAAGLAAASALSAFGQDPDTISVDTSVVNVGVSVYDRKGDRIEGLRRDDFEIFDNGKARDVMLFSAEEAPVSFGFVYDLHSDTSDITRRVLESIKTFTSRMKEEDDFFTIVFNDRGSLVLDFVPSTDQVRRHLSLGERGEPNSLYDAILLAAEKAEERRNVKKTLVIITDGRDTDSHHSFKELSRKLREVNVQIFTVFVGGDESARYSDITLGSQPRALDTDLTLDRAALDELSERSGGRAQEPVAEDVVNLVAVYNRIAAEMRNQYSLGFYPETPDGKWHKLEVKVKRRINGNRPRLVYRKGYQSPPAP